MAQDAGKFLGISVKVFQVLAWLSLAVQLLVGLIILVVGGEPVPIGGAEIPARLVGVLNFVAAGIYWFLFMFISHLTRLLLDLRGHGIAS